jgi:hypothetical protein
MGDVFKGNYQPPPVLASTGEQLGALVKFLPQLSQAYNQQILPTEQANLAAQQQIAPGQQALDASLYGTYGPQIAKTSSDIAAANAMRGAQSDAAVLAGPGQDVARAGLAAQQIADPEYYATRALAGQKTNDLLNSININGLSGSERAEVERSLNQQAQQGGSPDISSGIKTVQNAATFGNALQNKRNALGQAIGQATNFLPAAKSGVDVFQQVTGRAGMPNNTNAAQATSAQPVGAQANNLTSQLFGHVGDIQAQNYDINAARKPVTQFVNEAYKSAMSGAGGSAGCCFIFLESYNGLLPDSVRKCRDYYYEKEPLVARGYKLMANVLVPLMRSSRIVRWMVNAWMVTPLSKHGEFIFGRSDIHYRRTTRFWFSIWKTLGKVGYGL